MANLEQPKNNYPSLNAVFLATIAAISAFSFNPTSAFADNSTSKELIKPVQIEKEKISPPKPIPAKAHFPLTPRELETGDYDKIDNPKTNFASGVIFNVDVAGTNEHIAECFSEHLVNEVSRFSFKNSNGEFEEARFKYKFCLPKEFGIDVTFLFNNVDALKKFLHERIKNAPTAAEFKEKINSGAKLEIYTYRNHGNAEERFIDELRKVETYPVPAMIQNTKGGTIGVISFIKDSRAIVSGTSGSLGLLDGDNNFQFYEFGGYVTNGLLPKHKGLYRWSAEQNLYYPKDIEPGKPVKKEPGDIEFIDLMKTEYEKAQKIHSDLRKIPWEVFVKQGNVILVAPMTQQTYKIFAKNGTVKMHLDQASELSNQNKTIFKPPQN
jgi:hypothetical protein